MMYLIAQMLIFLLLAAAIGFAAAWLIRGAARPRAVKTDDTATWTARMSSAEADFEAKTLAAEAVNARLKADLHAAQNRAAMLEDDSGQRITTLEAALKTQALAAEALADERGQALQRMQVMFETAQADWRDRLSAAEDNGARLSEALEAVEASQSAAPTAFLAPVQPDPRLDALENELQAKTALIDTLEAALSDAETRRAQEANAAEAALSTLRQRVVDLEAAAPASARRPLRPPPPPGEDDLQTIIGIGPAAERTLKTNGIVTYRALALLTAEQSTALARQMRNFGASRDRWIDEARAQHLAKYGEEP